MGRAAAGRPRRRAARDAEQRPPAPRPAGPDPRGAAPEGRRRAPRQGHRQPVVAPGRGDPRRVGGPDDRHHRHRVRQVAVLPAPDPRRALPRLPRPRALPLPDEGARPGPGARAQCVRRQERAARDLRRRHAARAALARSAATATSSSPTPTCCTSGILPNHPAWANFLSNLAIVVVDEAHVYRGVFGSHVGNVLRRLRRIAAAYGTAPALPDDERHDRQPGRARRAPLGPRRLHGDRARRLARVSKRTIAMWNPPVTDEKLGTRRSVLSEAADLLAELVTQGARTIVFMKSRKAVELMAKFTQLALEDLGHADLAKRIAPYRAGYTPQQRRELERKLVERRAARRRLDRRARARHRHRLARRRDLRHVPGHGRLAPPAVGPRRAPRPRARRLRRRRRRARPVLLPPPRRVPRPPGRERDPRPRERADPRAARPVRRARGPARARRRGVPRPDLEDRPRSGSSAPASCASAPAASTSRAGPRSSRPRTCRCARPAATAA